MLGRVLRSVFRSGVAEVNEAGIALWRAGDLRAAESRFREALRRDPGNAPACSNLGMVLVEQRILDEGLARLTQAVELDPAHAGARINLANTLHYDGQVDAAIGHYREALRLAPEAAETRVNVVKPLMDACEWREVERIVAELLELHRGAPEARWAERVTPFVSLLLPLPAEFQKRLAIHRGGGLSRAYSRQRERIVRSRVASGSGRIRVGYVSGEFRNHALAHLTAGMYAMHDRGRFEIFAYSYGHADGSEYRARIESGCDRFVDVAGESFETTAARVARDGIDILVDMSGYAGGSRSEIFAMRPAPVQVGYLGYPGTLGADFIDYFVADAVALPERIEWQFTECIARLPHSYQVNDAMQRIAERPPDRAGAGLPQQGFVFCCFNQPYKIERRAFEAWMRILAAVPDAVLWLMHGGSTAAANLRREARERGVDPGRLVFAPPLPKAEHLARHRAADLFLDTRIVNAGTTASDALWAGLPLLTCPGETLGSRVAASLLSAIGLPELVARDAGEYECLAIELARDPARMARLRGALERNRLSTPLFDTRAYVNNLERAFEAMHVRFRSGEAPRPIPHQDRGSGSGAALL